MIYLIAAILCSSGVTLTLRFSKKDKDSQVMLAVNYIVAALFCLLFKRIGRELFLPVPARTVPTDPPTPQAELRTGKAFSALKKAVLIRFQRSTTTIPTMR